MERVLVFTPSFYRHFVDSLNENKFPLSNCRGQSYDHDSNMYGRYSKLQARINQLSEFAIYVPCAGHSLNVEGVKAADCNII